ncbi:Dipeptidyl aminopeptidase/acylaminoacyl peptidase [Rheinheimera pacifica]|uniref:Dipeptidyl aminopeptidase/acylaminoacyl peptidase n=1 Tax=Rheinheimera pacifica TaxID=173990 RepID=A0A1H6K7F4_9GAMM|nr:prolyl oligopeptidase family serine peptidase [Rheinheimera pacifica]SEH71025.1 Dipeptidyl aminopeptidase/acylaminoacyl peptidase [Rheinheimera pacifica]
MTKIRHSVLAVALCSFVLTSPLQARKAEPQTYQTAAISVPQVFNGDASIKLSMEQIMADPDWLGRQPEQALWSADSQQVFYQRKQQGNELRDWFVRPLAAQGNGEQVALASQHQIGSASAVYNKDRSLQAYIFEGNLFVRRMASFELIQLTRDSAVQTDPLFLLDGRIAYREGWTYYAIDLASGNRTELANLQLAEAPKAPAVPKGYLAQEQHKLIEFVALEQKNAEQRYAAQQQLQAQNSSMAPKAFYLGKDLQVVGASLSPKADYMLVSVRKAGKRNDKDIMPNYITANGDIAAQPVRGRVNDVIPAAQRILLLNLKDGSSSELSYTSLPGYNEDVLAEVKAENAKARGEKYKSEKVIRDIGLMNDWYWTQSAMRWHSNGEHVALMLKALDNKDRWIATVDLQKKTLVPQHRLHDTAWVNYSFNDYGWLNNADSLYYLSEESGYSHLYVKPLKGKAKKLTSGTFEVSDPVLSSDDQFIYFKANVAHPGNYEVYRAVLASGNTEQLTKLGGSTDFTLSPDEQKLLLRHSTNLMPEELYVADAAPGAEVKRLTDTISAEFKQLPLVAPQIVAVPSSHGEQPVFSKVYYPADYQQGEKRRAVIFNHGAGYLQNSDMGWSGYFREFFFHNLLVQQGYVVMDMDYRASKGYGRDWRTAIYRRMGTPEIEDLVDGVNWMVANANVDRNRIGTYGGSYGGFMTFMALFTEPDLFQAGAALRPVSDWAYYNHAYTSNILNTPAIDPIAYERSSPIYFTQGLKKPLLINAPMVDDNVFFQDVVRLVQRLIEQENINFETAIYPVEPHGFRQPSSWLDEYRRIYKLFEQNL